MVVNPSNDILASFIPKATRTKISRLGSGLIHQTFLIELDHENYVFQEFNTTVFPDPQAVMDNILKVQHVLSSYPEPTLTFLANKKTGTYLAEDPHTGSLWRCARHIPNTVSYDVAPEPHYLQQAAQAFALFGQRLSHLNTKDFHATIPRFHDTPHRLKTMLAAWEKAIPSRRNRAEFESLLSLVDAFPKYGLSGLISNQIAQGIAHNDTKLNNCLFRGNLPQVVCVIDLDTVMEGSWLLDFGDLCRTSVCPLPEDTEDLQGISIDEKRFLAVAQGYVNTLGSELKPEERERMVYAGFLMTLELALRFFTDHLQGDIYFGTQKPQHNLKRARAQTRLAQCWLSNRSRLEDLLGSLL